MGERTEHVPPQRVLLEDVVAVSRACGTGNPEAIQWALDEIERLRAENEAMRSALVFWKYDHEVQVEELREDIAQALIGYRDRVGGEPYRIADYLLVDFGRALDTLGAPLRLLIPENDWGINLEHVEVRRG